ncbi:putative COPII coat assembly protein sec-16 [Podospora fimiseda]|uniref:Protein transport protein sec16 n=1 Tax=Podospora fimiseda TaxID=252190 RepID=A0AAN7BMW8_9PEZI|nr:putative COPII coat assembly protein sec-16 [Podospora fimiseda]
MVSDAPNSSWHPAMMPNSIPEPSPRNVPETIPTNLPIEDHEFVTEKYHSHQEEGQGHDAWFGDDGTADSNWLGDANDAPTSAPTSAENVEQHEVAESIEHNPDAEFTESANASKHLSTMSFTRTVSEEIMFNDDDDAEWNRPEPSITDPSNFFPDTERTNSFPNTSHLEHEAPRQLDQPLPSTEAEDLIREIEREESNGKAADLGFEDSFGHENGDDSHQFIGGELSGTAEEALEARFDEGLPLIPSAEPVASHHNNNQESHDIFGDNGAGDEDDFFSNVQNNEAHQEQDDSTPKPLERKSTADVLNALDVGPSKTSFSPVEEILQEEEPPVEASQRPETEQTTQETPEVAQEEPKVEPKEDLDAKWKEMFGDEDEEEFLPDEETEPKEEIDAAAFLPSDDESLLDDEADAAPVTSDETPVASGYQPAPAAQPVNNPYLPAQVPTTPALTPVNSYFPQMTATPTQANPYLPPAPIQAVQPPAPTPFATTTPISPTPANYGYVAQPPPVQEKSKAQSFVDKAKGGYTSPYDLPMEVVKPKKRASALRNTSAPIPPSAVMPPPRSASLQAPPLPPNNVPAPVLSRPGSSHTAQPPPSARKASQEGFFEDLPIITKVRPASRHSNNSLPSPTGPAQCGPPSHAPVPHSPNPYAAQPPPPVSQSVNDSRPGIPQLVAPPPVNPYASITSPTTGLTPTPPAAASARYSPAPPSAPPLGGAIPPPSSSYSPAPLSRQASGAYAPNPSASAPPLLPHQPRTSSPLAHFEITHEKVRPHGHLNQVENAALSEKRSVSSLYDSRLQRVSSLPPTREVEEEDSPAQAQLSSGQRLPPPPMSPPDSRYAAPPQSARQTPPPPLRSMSSMLSPPIRAMSSHSPLVPSPDFAPPPRSQTQSPGALYGNRAAPSIDPIPRPSSVQDSASPTRAGGYIPHVSAPVAAPSATSSRPRGFSQNLNVIPPTDGREHDPLQRWRGAPLITWGVGGTMATMFPKEVPRYGINQSVPAVIRSPGDVKIKNAKDTLPLEERLAKFPGPLKGKSKKKEAISWLSAGIETLERALPQSFDLQHMSHDDKRASERVLLWKILRVFIENDGVLEGNPTVEKAVRDLLSPAVGAIDAAVPYLNGASAPGVGNSPATGMQADAVNSSVVEKIRQHLFAGESEQAIWAAVDQRMWGHALLLSKALKPDLYKQVAQEFVRKEVNFPGHNNESLAALYQVLSGNHEETVDELVPVHARAGLQLVVTHQTTGPTKNAMEGLDKWRETLGLILSNRSADDARSINSLGVLLSGYGRAEAAHICFMFARSHTVFGGFDDPNSNFVLVGSDHKKQAEQFAKEIEPLLLSEVYEYGQSLAGGSNVAVTNPHLAGYKLQHAYALAEHGFRDKALQYCETIATAITAQTKRSPYHHLILEHAVEDLMKRLKEAPSQESNSWIPKPTMNKVSDSMWNRFNKFVAGDDNDETAQRAPSGDVAEAGPFARIAGGTPTISRPPSANNLETFGAVPSYGMPVAPISNPPVAMGAPPTRAGSRYAPGAGPAAPSSNYAPRSSMERTSGEYNRSSFDLPRRSLDMQSGNAGTYSPVRSASPAQYTPYSAGFPSQESPRGAPAQQHQVSQPPAPAPGYQPYGYPAAPTNGTNADTGSSTTAASQGFEPTSQASEVSGYQPPSYGYEPPSFTPYEQSSNENKEDSGAANGGSSYEPPSFQPYSYEPPSFEVGPDPAAEDGGSSEDSKPKPKRKGIMYDDDDDFPMPKPSVKSGEKSKEEKDRENAEMFRKAAEEDAKRAEAAKQSKKGWGFGSWFGGKKETASQDLNSGTPNKPIRAKLGEANSFYYDPELKRWVNKNGNAEDNAKKATPPPPKSAPRSASSSPSLAPTAGPPMGGGLDAGRASAPPGGPPRTASSGNFTPPHSATLAPSASESNLGPPPGPVAMLRSASNTSTASAPPASRPLSNSSSIDDLLGAPGPRKGVAKKPRKSARYVDVMNRD